VHLLALSTSPALSDVDSETTFDNGKSASEFTKDRRYGVVIRRGPRAAVISVEK